MSLTSYRAAPPRVNPFIWAPAGVYPGLDPGRGLCSNHGMAWEGLACQAAPELLDCRQERRIDLPMRGKAGIRPDLGVGEALGGAARDILHEARDALDDRARPDAAAVHEYRKDMKRWRALLRLITPFLGLEGDGLQREARDLARELAPARDAQAALDALAD